MTHVSTGQFTITDMHDITYALLTSESGFVPVDASGVPKTSLTTVPLTTQMQIFKGDAIQPGWTFSRIQTNATSTINSSNGVLSVTAISADMAYIDMTASKQGEPSITKRFTVTKVYQGLQGTQGDPGSAGADGLPGPQGPAGELGALGIYESDGTIYIDGFGSDGQLGLGYGYIYNGLTRETVQAYSEALVSDGQGYVIFNSSWTPNIKFARMQTNGDSVRWEEYNNSLNTVSTELSLVIGRFHKDGLVIKDVQLVPPMQPHKFTISNFMELLSDKDVGQIAAWAEALGVQQFFSTLATSTLFSNVVKTNHLEIEKSVNIGTEASPVYANFILKLTNNGDLEYPILTATRQQAGSQNIEKLFEINSKDGSVYIKGSGTFQGTITHEALVTQAYQSGNSIGVTAAGYAWNTTDLYNGLTSVSADSTIKSASGSYAGKTINGITRLADSNARAMLGSASKTTQVNSDKYSRWVYVHHIIVPANATILTVSCQYYFQSTYCAMTIVKNYNVSMETTPATDTYLGGTKLTYIVGGKPYSSWRTHTATYTVSPGDRIGFFVLGYNSGGDNIYLTYGRNTYFYAYHPTIGPGVFLRNTDGTYGLISQSQYQPSSNPFSLSSPQSWASSGNLLYKRGNDLYNHAEVQNLAVGTVYPVSGSATVHFLENGSASGYTVQSIRRDAAGVTLGTTAGDIPISNWAGAPSAGGLYKSLSVSLTKIGQVRALLASSVLPLYNNANDLKLIGQGSNPFNAGYFNNLVLSGRTLNARVIASGIDLNTVVEPGFYRVSGTHANLPSGGAWGQMLVIYGGADTIAQFIVNYGSAQLYIRSGNPSNVGGSGSWTAWRTI